jgi:hypothetical protein
MDIQSLLTELARAIQSPDFPSASAIPAALGLDMSHATVTQTPTGPVGINDAIMPDFGDVGVIAAISPIRQIVVVFRSHRPAYREIASATLGGNQHVQSSNRGEGLAVIFDIGPLKGVLTASGPNGIIETLSVEAPPAAGIS